MVIERARLYIHLRHCPGRISQNPLGHTLTQLFNGLMNNNHSKRPIFRNNNLMYRSNVRPQPYYRSDQQQSSNINSSGQSNSQDPYHKTVDLSNKENLYPKNAMSALPQIHGSDQSAPSTYDNTDKDNSDNFQNQIDQNKKIRRNRVRIGANTLSNLLSELNEMRAKIDLLTQEKAESEPKGPLHVPTSLDSQHQTEEKDEVNAQLQELENNKEDEIGTEATISPRPRDNISPTSTQGTQNDIDQLLASLPESLISQPLPNHQTMYPDFVRAKESGNLSKSSNPCL